LCNAQWPGSDFIPSQGSAEPFCARCVRIFGHSQSDPRHSSLHWTIRTYRPGSARTLRVANSWPGMITLRKLLARLLMFAAYHRTPQPPGCGGGREKGVNARHAPNARAITDHAYPVGGPPARNGLKGRYLHSFFENSTEKRRKRADPAPSLDLPSIVLCATPGQPITQSVCRGRGTHALERHSTRWSAIRVRGLAIPHPHLVVTRP
jgi:hypothetical protein